MEREAPAPDDLGLEASGAKGRPERLGREVAEVPDAPVQACLADSILVLITALQTGIDRYRTYVSNAENRTRSEPSGNPDF